ncbi:MAG TPA: ROK family protein, partial [Candidatus Limnocylindrales bacterium]|nr:ROK family protein [Candidatus Limnocylindrales bacterium]
MTTVEQPAVRVAQGSLVAGVDVGGTKVAALVVDDTGQVRGKAVRPMADRSHGGVEPIVGAVKAALAEAGAGTESLRAIGIGVPGRIDARAGIVNLATNLGWRDLPLAALIEDQLGVATSVENDVGLAAAGLVRHPVAEGARSLAYVAVGTGIGAGLVLNGRLYQGDHGMAGEIGHVIVVADGIECRCGQHGCLETIASGPHIARRAAEALQERGTEADRILRAGDPITAKTVYEAAAAAEPIASAIATETGAFLARSVAGLMFTCDLDLVLLGG